MAEEDTGAAAAQYWVVRSTELITAEPIFRYNVGLVLFLAPLPAVLTAVPVAVFDRRGTASLVTWPNPYPGRFILPAEKTCIMSKE